MKTINSLLVLMALLVIFFSCGGSDEPIEDDTTDDVVTVETDMEPEQIYAAVSIENGAGVLNELRFGNCSPSNNDEWGPNYDYVPGEDISFEVEPGEYYDLRCVDNAQNEYYIWDVLIEQDGFRWQVELSEMDNTFAANPHAYFTSKGDAAVTIHLNPGCGVIKHIYCTQLNSQDLLNEADRLDRELLYPGDEFTFHIPTGHGYKYSLRLENTNGDEFWFYGIVIDENGLYLDLTQDDMTYL
ncbi:MAG: hypothetical protein K8S15_12415 [Candidatus Aegiribacteria sp.]|nr:hypothetical protein [Candidatus Aegiribacteria sp.]